MSVYGARTVNERGRRTKAEMEALREALYEIVAENEPVTVRGVFYLAETAGLVPKDDTTGYRPVQRELLKMRREGLIPWGSITDGSRSRFGHHRYGGWSPTPGRSRPTTGAITGTGPKSLLRSG